MQSQRLRQTQDLKIHKIQNMETTLTKANTALTATNTNTKNTQRVVQGMTHNLQMVFLPLNLMMSRNRKRMAEVLKLLYTGAMIETYALEFFAQK